MSKTCIKCGETKPLSEYHVNKRCKDGHAPSCKTCRCAYQRRFSKTIVGKETQVKADQRRNRLFPQRRSARTKLFFAVVKGIVKPHPCWVCGDNAEAHHPDYSRPLDVVWLCKNHHRQAHQAAR